MTRSILVLGLCLLAAVPALAGDLPDPSLTPGAINPEVTQDNLDQTICVHGWTKTVRPPVSYTNALKRQQLATLGLSGMDPHSAEEDHRVNLGCGGNPMDPHNLYPQKWDGRYGAHAKDRLEVALQRDVCARKITLVECQAILMGDWRIEYDRRFGAAESQQY